MPGNRWRNPEDHPRLQDPLTYGSLPDGLQICVILRGIPLRMNWLQVMVFLSYKSTPRSADTVRPATGTHLRITPLVSCTGRSYATIRPTRPGSALDRVRCTTCMTLETEPTAKEDPYADPTRHPRGSAGYWRAPASPHEPCHRLPAGHAGQLRRARGRL